MSKTRLFQAIKSLDAGAVAALLEARPELGQVKDEHRRNALHLLCSLPGSDKTRGRSLALAERLLGLGFSIDEPAFVEGPFKATPLWYAISRGRNVPLARWLLKKGSTPEYCLWSAGFQDNVEAIDLLVGSGARLDPVAEDETPFLSAIKVSRFAAAERLLHHGANVNFRELQGHDGAAFPHQEEERPEAHRHAAGLRCGSGHQEWRGEEPARHGSSSQGPCPARPAVQARPVKRNERKGKVEMIKSIWRGSSSRTARCSSDASRPLWSTRR